MIKSATELNSFQALTEMRRSKAKAHVADAIGTLFRKNGPTTAMPDHAEVWKFRPAGQTAHHHAWQNKISADKDGQE